MSSQLQTLGQLELLANEFVDSLPCIHQLFEAQVNRTPDAIAIFFENEQITYAELNARANQLAHYLLFKGVSVGDRVAICTQRSLAMVVSLIGVLKAGAVAVPLDPESPMSRTKYILNDTQTRWLLVQQELSENYEDFAGTMILVDAGQEQLEQQSKANIHLDITAEYPACVYYTSGSTGNPKGVLGHHRGVGNFFSYLKNIYDLDANDVVLQIAPFTFDASLRDLIGPLTVGAMGVLVKQDEARDPSALLAKIKAHQVTCILSIVPSRLSSLVEEAGEKDIPFNSTRLVLVSGEPLYWSLCRKAQLVFGKDTLIVNQYGPTECTMTTTYFSIPTQASEQGIVCLGTPIPHSKLYVLDEELKPVSKGDTGEAYLSGVGLSWGYLGLPDLTAEKFQPDPFAEEPGSRLYRTGDVVKVGADSTLHFAGRIDRQVKLNGVRVELGEIESILLRFPLVQSCAVIVQNVHRNLVSHERLIALDSELTQQQQLVAYYVSGQGRISLTKLRAFVGEHLPGNMIPHEFIQMETLPVNAHGKIDFRALPVPENLRPELDEPFVQARDDVESKVVAAWQEILALDSVGVNDDFFELGGDSLKAMQVVSRLCQRMSVNLTIEDLLQARTPANLSIRIQQASPKNFTSISQKKESNQDFYPLSFAEQGIWFLWKLDPDNPYYIARGIIEIRGELDLRAFQQAWQKLIDRHEILRVRFTEVDGRPAQQFVDTPDAALPIIDLSDLPRETCINTIRQQAETEIDRPFDLANSPLLRSFLYKMSQNDHALLLVMHEIIIDVWSIRVLLSDLSALYKCCLETQCPLLEPLAINYSDFVLWENQNVTRTGLSHQEKYWSEELSGELPILSLPLDRPRPRVLSHTGKSESLLLDSNLTKNIKLLCKQENVTLFSTLLAAFNVLLNVYTGQKDLIVGAPFANRSNTDLEKIVGFQLNMLPLRANLTNDPSFRALLKQVKGKVVGAITNSQYPFLWMLDLVNTPRDPQISPVFQVMFNMLTYTDLHVESSGLEMEYKWFATAAPKYDLSLYAQEYSDQIYLQLSYSPDLFDGDTVNRMLENYEVLLGSITESPDVPVSRLETKSKAEHKALLNDFNDTTRNFGNTRCIIELLEQQVEDTPDRVALICEDKYLSYAELNNRANNLAHYLRRFGVGPETVVGICIERSLEMVVAILGVLKAGGAYVPLDPHHPLHRVETIIHDTKPELLLLEQSLDQLSGYEGHKVYVDQDWEQIAKESGANPVCRSTPKDLLKIVYTSSSTGKPKGTLITTDSVLNRLFWMWEAHPFDTEDVAVLQKSYALVAAVWELFGGLLKGIPTVVLSHNQVMDPELCWQALVRHRVSFLLASPSFLRGVLDQAGQQSEKRHDLRFATTSAEPITPAMAAEWKECFPNVPLFNLYGSTECSSNVTAYDTAHLPTHSQRVPIGKPLANTRVYILDKGQRPVPFGVTGEMYVGGACLARGYLNSPELEAERFIPDPFARASGERLHRTGDLARVTTDGTFELLGRSDFQVKIRGFRVDLGEIESVLRQHGMVDECATAIHEDESGQKFLVAYVVAKGTYSVSPLLTFLRERLPEFMVPSFIMELSALPLTANGKLDRNALPQPERIRPELDKSYAAPGTKLEQIIAEVWRDVLMLDRIGTNDNFFDLGGNSMLIVQAHEQLQSAIQRKFPLVQMFEHPTVRMLAENLAETRTSTPTKDVAEPRLEKLSQGKDRIKRLRRQRQQES